MKKILLGTTTLISAAGLFAGAALAETPKVTLGGVMDTQLGIMSDDQDDDMRNHAFRNDTTITIRVDGKTDGGLGYGGGVDLEGDTGEVIDESDPSISPGFVAGSDYDDQGFNASRTFIYVEGSWGRFEAGSEAGAQGTMKVDASNIARATGGIDGDWTYFSNSSAQYWATPDLDLGYGLGNLGNEREENLNKITYYTPRFSGFQLGLSYIPDEASRGQAINRSDTISGASENIFAGGISYEGKFDQISLAAAVTGETGSAQVSGNEDLATWNAGLELGYMGFSIAGSYGDIGDSNRTSASNADDTHYWTVGLAYETGPFGASVTYLDSQFDLGPGNGSNDFNNVSVGVDYQLAPGLTPYAEISWFEQDAADNDDDNDGTVGIVGAQLNF